MANIGCTVSTLWTRASRLLPAASRQHQRRIDSDTKIRCASLAIFLSRSTVSLSPSEAFKWGVCGKTRHPVPYRQCRESSSILSKTPNRAKHKLQFRRCRCCLLNLRPTALIRLRLSSGALCDCERTICIFPAFMHLTSERVSSQASFQTPFTFPARRKGPRGTDTFRRRCNH